MMKPVILENDIFRLTLSANGAAESLILKANGTECLSGEKLPFCTLTEERPYNNEIKLTYPTGKTTFGANRLRMENGKLIVGFELIGFEAVVDVRISAQYMVFTLTDFLVTPGSFGLGVVPIQPPVLEFRLVQLALSHRARHGTWLNVLWDDAAAVNVLAACPYAQVGAETRREHTILYGETLRDVQLKHAGVALLVSEPERLLDGLDALETELDLPRGVASRRSPFINRSYYWVSALHPGNVEEHIRYAKQGGFTCMLLYYHSFVEEDALFSKTGVYAPLRPEYRNGKADLIAMLERIKAAGITPGLHILHSHIGLQTPYLTPVADHRLNLTRRFTLAAPVAPEDTTIYVEENPEGVPVYEAMRILRFMGELIQYEGYTTEPPYRFTGCKRGFNNTIIRHHEIGTMGGILDISEFAANSAYINQNNSLQDEIAGKIAEIYDAGFEFLYFDGSEGVNPPFDIHVGLAQWRVYRQLAKKPLFCEGAAKSNFSWHMLSGGNAFDIWPPEVFKEMTVRHPFREAASMVNDFTRVNFGWWDHRAGQRPDILEYGTALAAAWDCPGAFRLNPGTVAQIPRTDDILETLRRWELARASGFLTPEIKKRLRHTEQEHTLLINEEGQLELAEWTQVKDALNGDETVTVFLLTYRGMRCAVCWHNQGDGRLALPLGDVPFRWVESLGGEALPVEQADGTAILPVGRKRYLLTSLPADALANAFVHATLLP